MKTHRIAVIAGDGIGKEVIPAGIEIINLAADQSGWLFGAWRRETHGKFERIAARDGIAAAVRHRDGPFWPEPFGPLSKRTRVDRVEEDTHG